MLLIRLVPIAMKTGHHYIIHEANYKKALYIKSAELYEILEVLATRDIASRGCKVSPASEPPCVALEVQCRAIKTANFRIIPPKHVYLNIIH